MERAQEQEPQEQLPPLKVYQEDATREDTDGEPDRKEDSAQDDVEEFWAGRNHAMRQSARVAA
jgi:hypothetical protein